MSTTTEGTTSWSGAIRQLPQPLRVCLLLALVFSAVLVVLIARAGVSVPFSDEVLFGYLYGPIAEGKFPALRDLVAAHNGHPYLIQKSLFSGVLRFDLPWSTLMFAQVPALAAAFAVAVRQMPVSMGRISTLAAAGLAMVILTPHQWENLYWALQFAFPLSLLSSLAAFHFATRYVAAPSDSALGSALACAAIASLSNGAGIFAAALTIGAIFSARRFRHVLWSVIAAVAIAVMYVFSIRLSTPPPTSQEALALGRIADHALRMLASCVTDFGQADASGLVVGAALAVLVSWCMFRALRQWRNFTFELLCLAFGGILIAGVTYARLRIGIFQPEAPRYVPLVMPVAIALILILLRTKQRVLLSIFLFAVTAGYLHDAWIAWGASPFHHAARQKALVAFCLTGELTTGPQVSAAETKSMQQVFCDGVDAPVPSQASEQPGAQVAAPSPLVIEDYGPRRAKAGQPFDLKTGKSGLWLRANQSLLGQDAAVYFDGHRLGETAVEDHVVAGAVPTELLAKPGKYGVEIRTGADGEKQASNKVEFVVE